MNRKTLNTLYNQYREYMTDAAPFAAGTLRAYMDALAKIDQNDELNDMGRGRRKSAAKESAQEEIKSYFDDARYGIEEIRKAVSEALEMGDASVEAQLLQEIRQGRAWDRYRLYLQNGHDPHAAIQAVAEDPAGLQALRVELPAYVRAIQAFDTEQDAADAVDALLEAVDAAEAPHLTDVQASAASI